MATPISPFPTPPPLAPLNETGTLPGTPPTTYQWLVAWLLLIVLLAVAAQTEIGHTVIYYALVLILVFLLVTQYQFVAGGLAPIGQKLPATG